MKQVPYQACGYYWQATEQELADACYELDRYYSEVNFLLEIDHSNFNLTQEYADKRVELGEGKTEFNNIQLQARYVE